MKISIDGTGEICYPLSSNRERNWEGLLKSTIWVEKDDQRVNAKSLLGVLSLGIIKGSTIDLIADGTDEKEAVDALVELISSDFAD